MIRQAVILIGGMGTRLGELTADTPKPLLPVGDRPFLDYLLSEVVRYGVDDLILLAGYRAEKVVAHYQERKIGGARIRCFVESAPAGTGGALAGAAEELAPEFYLANGDSIFDVNLLDLARAAQMAGGLAHLALRPIVDSSRSGVVSLEGSRITGFLERGAGGPAVINGGVYVLRRAVMELVTRAPMSLESEIFSELATRGALTGTVYDDRFFLDIGVPTAFTEAQTKVPTWATRPAIFFDRDGVLNRDTGYVHRPADFTWTEGAREAVRAVNDSGRLAIVVTNQAGVARGLYDESAVEALHRWMAEDLARIGAHVDAFYYCPHHPDFGDPPYRQVCDCRKPRIGLIRRATAEHLIDLRRSLLIGDQPTDLAAAAAAGIPGHKFSGGNLRDFVTSLLR
jgi:D,D-heptose 1,7-bisphosphate phosphatase